MPGPSPSHKTSHPGLAPTERDMSETHREDEQRKTHQQTPRETESKMEHTKRTHDPSPESGELRGWSTAVKTLAMLSARFSKFTEHVKKTRLLDSQRQPKKTSEKIQEVAGNEVHKHLRSIFVCYAAPSRNIHIYVISYSWIRACGTRGETLASKASSEVTPTRHTGQSNKKKQTHAQVQLLRATSPALPGWHESWQDYTKQNDKRTKPTQKKKMPLGGLNAIPHRY